MTHERLLDESDDWNLLAETAGGNQDAFRHIFDRYNKMVFAFLRKRLLHTESAEDACQEVFLRLWKKASTSEKMNAKFSTYLFGIAYNVGWEYRRAAAKNNEVGGVDLEQMRKQPQPEAIDIVYQLALDELAAPRNWRKGQPMPSLAFHLAVYRRRYAGIEPKERTDMGQESNVLAGSAVIRRYLWLRLWASGKGSIS